MAINLFFSRGGCLFWFENPPVLMGKALIASLHDTPFHFAQLIVFFFALF